MALDTLIKKFFPAITAVLVAIIAYLQASGVMELVAQGFFGSDGVALDSANPAPSAGGPRLPRVPSKSASAIIAHNPFDHATDLNPKPEVKEEPLAEAASVGKLDVSDPLNAEGCAGVIVQIITQSDDPTWSIAVLKGEKDERPFLRRVGDTVGDYEVQYIGYNRLQRSPAVWMSQGSKLCQSLLFPTEAIVPAPAESGAAPVSSAPSVPSARSTGNSEVPPEIADKIEKVSETEFNVDRAVVDNILENQALLMRTTRIVPEKGADGKTVGIRLFGVRPQTLLGTLGLQNGDRLETINGFEMANPEKALEAYARLRSANKLSIKITRRGAPVTMDFNIK